MPLQKYRQKRNFSRTQEPYGNEKKLPPKPHSFFVVQKHAASHLHYDFRLEMNGVLKSWAVPKGPCLDPTIKRLAVQVEDHPLSYGSFEGTIPKGEYGGGTVMVWDQGQWQETPHSPGYQKGDLKFKLTGKKLKGLWKLIQIKKDPKNWLLIKIEDEQARAENEYDITQDKALSVLTQRTMEEIAQGVTQPRRKTGKKTVKQQKQIQLSLVNLTHPERILYPADDITKLDLAQYYEAIQLWILPYIRNRPLSLVRCPQGSQGECFYQKHLTEKEKESQGLFSIPIQEKEKTRSYIYIKNLTGLLKLVQMNVLEIHPWGARVDNIEKPDRIIFDLDPAIDVPWDKVVAAAWEVKEELADFGLTTFVKTTGGKGLHVEVPIIRRYRWDQVKTFARQFAEYMVAKHPQHYVATAIKNKRQAKIFIDYLRNDKGATAIAPYSTRARDHAPVAVPLAWQELSVKLHSNDFTLENLPKRLAKLKQDPWQDYFHVKQGIPQLR